MKVLIIQPALPGYRLDFFDELCRVLDCEVMVLYGGKVCKAKSDNKNLTFKHHSTLSILRLKVGLYNPLLLLRNDKIICHYDISWFFNFLLYLFFKKKFIFWGIGLGNSDIVNNIKNIITFKSPLILYYEKNLVDYRKRFPHRKNIYYASNTVGFKSPPYKNITKENRILIVGSLDERKSTGTLISYFHKFITNTTTDLVVDIVGDGDEYLTLKEYIRIHKLENRVILHGRIEGAQLFDFYAKSLVSCSYGQAGLSILQSFFHGVPYVTCSNAISGGEVSVITNGENGLLLKPIEQEWIDFFLDLHRNSNKYIRMGITARSNYINHYSLNNMASVFLRVMNNEDIN